MTNIVQDATAVVVRTLGDPSVPLSFKIFTVALLIVGGLGALGWVTLPFALFGVSTELRRANRRWAAMETWQRDMAQAPARLDVLSARLRELEQTNSQLDQLNHRLKELITSQTKLGVLADRLGELAEVSAQLRAVVDRMERFFEAVGKDHPPPPPVV